MQKFNIPPNFILEFSHTVAVFSKSAPNILKLRLHIITSNFIVFKVLRKTLGLIISHTRTRFHFTYDDDNCETIGTPFLDGLVKFFGQNTKVFLKS